MKLTHNFKRVTIYLLICLASSAVLAFWDEPVFLDELNDFTNGYAASRPAISADENTIIFVRKDSSGQPRVWQARRNPDTGIFDDQRALTELRKNGQSVYGTWISEDNKRLYYCGPNAGWTQRQLWMAARNSPDDHWSDTKLHTELQIQDLLHCCSLTADETYILFQATPNTTPRQMKNYYATRNAVNESFSAPQGAYELDAIEAGSPIITPDGLTVYFTREVAENFTEYWMGRRDSILEPFSEFEALSDINDDTTVTALGWMSPSWDGKKLYYHHRRDVIGDVYTCGIYVSYWVDPPEVIVDNNLVELIEAKSAIVEQLQMAIEKEVETLDILNMLQEMMEEDSEEFEVIQKTKIQIQKALCNEILAQSKIKSSIHELEKGLSYYRMEES